MSDAPGAPRRRGAWLAVGAIVAGAALLAWALTRPVGYASFGWFAYAPAPEAVRTSWLLLVAILAGPLLVGLGAGFLLGRRRR